MSVNSLFLFILYLLNLHYFIIFASFLRCLCFDLKSLIAGQTSTSDSRVPSEMEFSWIYHVGHTVC